MAHQPKALKVETGCELRLRQNRVGKTANALDDDFHASDAVSKLPRQLSLCGFDTVRQACRPAHSDHETAELIGRCRNPLRLLRELVHHRI